MLSSRSIYLTTAGKITISNAELIQFVKFLIAEKNRIILPADQQKRLIGIKTMSQTPISKLFTRLVETNKDQKMVLIAAKDDSIQVPEVATFRHMTFDILQIKDVNDDLRKSLAVSPFADKIIENITPWLASNGEVFNNTLSFQCNVIRDFLSRSYYTSQGRLWLDIVATRLYAKLYSISLSTLIAKIFNLEYQLIQPMSIVFLYSYLSKVLPQTEDVKTYMKSNANYFGIYDPNMIDDVIAHLNEVRQNKPVDMDIACKTINTFTPGRVKLDKSIIYVKTQSWGPDINQTLMALEYPPYWVYICLLAASGVKIGATFTLKQIPEFSKVLDNVEGLLSNNSFWSGI